MSVTPRVRAGAASAVLVAAFVLSGPAARAQSAANPNDQPTAGTLPPGTSTTQDGPTGDAPSPSRVKPSTPIRNGSAEKTRTNPLDHLPPNYRRRGGGDE